MTMDRVTGEITEDVDVRALQKADLEDAEIWDFVANPTE